MGNLLRKLAAFACLALATACSTTPQPPTTAQAPAVTSTAPTGQVSLDEVERLDPAQIRALSPEQVNGVIGEAERDLDVLAASLEGSVSPAADSRWPNYGYTLYVATSVSYETYLSSYYRHYSGPNWSDDGCSGPTPPVIFDDNACRQHDFGYRNVSQYGAGRNENVRKSIDERFLSNMRLRCDRYWNHWYQYPLKQACKVDALGFYAAVRNAGSSAFYSTPRRY